jgi:hypothetical protein
LIGDRREAQTSECLRAFRAAMGGAQMLAKLLCRLGVHRWKEARDADGDAYEQCGRCGKDTLSLWAGQLDTSAREWKPPAAGF